VLRRVFGPKREEVAGGWRRLYNEELYNWGASPNILGRSNQGGCGGWGKWHAWEAYKVMVR